MAVKKKTNTANREGKRWAAQSKALKLRLPKEIKDAIIEEAHVQGDLAKVLLFALRNVDRKDIRLPKTRKVTGLALSAPQLVYIGAKARAALKEWAEDESISVNSLMIQVLTSFVRHLKRSKTLREALKLELRALRGIPITE